MDLTARKTALEQTIQQATQQIGRWTEQLIGAKAQLALILELEKEPTVLDWIAQQNGPDGASEAMQRFDGTPHGPTVAHHEV